MIVNFCAFDGWTVRGQNRQGMSFHRGFAIALLATLVAGPCLGVCAGWSASDHARMACCADKAQDEADSCCAKGENRQNSDTSSTSIGPALQALEPIALTIASVVLTLPTAAFDLDSHDPLTADSERHVLLSVFLI